MKIRKNTFKQKILSGQKTFGIWNGIPHSYAAEICAGAGFDWVTIDGEHAPFDLNSILQSVQAIQLHDTSAIVRIPSADPILIKQLLEIGVQNILCPMVESVEEAEQIAKAMRYPPSGTRGLGTSLGRAAQWDRVKDYLQVANEEMCCIAQMETLRGVEILDDMLKIPDLDVILIGPADLAASMGYLGQSGAPEVVNLIKECIRTIVAAGKVAGFLTVSKRLIQEYIAAGALMIGVGLDTVLLARTTAELAKEYIE